MSLAAHNSRSAALVLETVGIALLLGAAALYGDATGRWPLTLLAIGAQGCWLHRFYTAALEAVHGKLISGAPRLNDALGQALLLPLVTPLRVYRKIHRFHHGFNRRDEHTSALDVFVVAHPHRALVRAGCQAGRLRTSTTARRSAAAPPRAGPDPGRPR